MEKYLLTLALLFNLCVLKGQTLKFLDEDTKVSIETNIDFASSADDTRSDAQAGSSRLVENS